MNAKSLPHVCAWLILAAVGTAQGQLVNNQASIVVESGASLIVDGGVAGAVEVSQLLVQGPSIPFGMLNSGGGVIDDSVPGVVSWSFNPPLIANLDLGALFPPNLSQADFDADYSATYVPFGSTQSLPAPIRFVPEPGTAATFIGMCLASCLRRPQRLASP